MSSSEPDSPFVRPILRDEEPKRDELVRTHHYLGFERLVGESMKYIVPSEPPIRRTLQSSEANARDRRPQALA